MTIFTGCGDLTEEGSRQLLINSERCPVNFTTVSHSVVVRTERDQIFFTMCVATRPRDHMMQIRVRVPTDGAAMPRSNSEGARDLRWDVSSAGSHSRSLSPKSE